MKMKSVADMTDEEIQAAIDATKPQGVEMDAANLVIDSREGSHGPYREQAQFAQLLKGICRRHKNWNDLPGEQKESIEMILLKISRVMSGNKPEPDHWLDMSGYAMLIYNLLTTGDHRAS